MGVGWKGRRTHPQMVHTEKGIDQRGHVSTRKTVGSEVIAVVGALEWGDNKHGDIPQAGSAAFKTWPDRTRSYGEAIIGEEISGINMVK